MSAGVVVERTSLWPSARKALEVLGGEGGDQLAQTGHGPAPGRPHLVLAPAPGHGGGRPHQAHGEQVLAQAVVDGVEEPVAGQGTAFGQHPFLDHGPIQDLSRGLAEQRAVEVDEDGARCHELEPKAVGWPVQGPKKAIHQGRKLGEGIAGGEGDPFSRLIRFGGGASVSLRSEVILAPPQRICQSVSTDT